MQSPDVATMTVEVRIRRLWLLNVVLWCWVWIAPLIPWADPWPTTRAAIRLLRPEMRVSKRRGWESVGRLEWEAGE
jgi:hypothetical protein